jgi:hypothetical protein
VEPYYFFFWNAEQPIGKGFPEIVLRGKGDSLNIVKRFNVIRASYT